MNAQDEGCGVLAAVAGSVGHAAQNAAHVAGLALASTASGACDATAHAAQFVGAGVRHGYQTARDATACCERGTQRYIQREPAKALLIAAGLGIALGLACRGIQSSYHRARSR